MTGIPHDLDLGALLAEQAFVRRLARSLVFDQDRADDVVQQTWLAALQTPLRDARAARPFLRRVVQSVASNLGRGERRRRQREAAATPADAAPSVAEVFERESMRQEVVSELAALAEPYRTTLVLRFFEDLQPHEIAARQKVPAATVRTRLKRGLEMVRVRLDARHDGDRRAWALALLPLVKHGKEATALAGSGLIGILLMKKLWMFAAIALLSVGALWWQPWAGPALAPVTIVDAAPTVTTTTPPPPTQVTPVERAAVAPENAAVPVTPVADTSATLRGRLVLDGGAPAAKRRVRLVGVDVAHLFVDGSDGMSLASLETTSGDDGVFTFDTVPAGALLALHGGVDAPHSAYVPVRTTPTAGATVDVGDILLEARGTIVGRLEDEDGEPVAGADVWAADVPGLITLAVNVERFDPSQGGMMALPTPDQNEDPRAYALRLRSYLGRTFLMESLPNDDLGQVHVLDTPAWARRLWEALPMARGRTQADGTFELRDVAPGMNLLVLRKAGLNAAVRPNLKVTAGARADAGTLTAEPGETLAVQVTDSGGSPVAGARVRVATLPLAGFRGLTFAEAEVRTDSGGNARIAGLPNGRVLVAARRGDDEPWTTLSPSSVMATAKVVLPTSATLRVAVRAPIAGPTPHFVLRQGPAAGELARLGLLHPVDLRDRLRAEADGVFAIERVTPGTYVLDVTLDGCVARQVLVAMPRTAPLDVALTAAAPAFEVLVTSMGSAPIAGARVLVDPSDQPGLTQGVLPTYFGLPHWKQLPEELGTTDAQGRLRVVGRAPGPLRLWAMHVDHGPGSLTLELPAPLAHMQLARAATLEGTVTERGVPVDPTRWQVTIQPTTKTRAAPAPFVFAALRADGTFRARGLEAGLHRVEIQEAFAGRLSLSNLVEIIRAQIFAFGNWGGSDMHVRDVVLAAGATRQLRIDLDIAHEAKRAPAQVFGRVLCDGAPVPGAKLVLVRRFQSEQSWYSLPNQDLTVADADGRFTTDKIDEGRQEVGVIDPRTGQQLAVVEVIAAAGESRELNVSVRTGTIAGKVLAPSGRSLDGATISGQAEGGATLHATVDAAGAFEVRGVASGQWTLDVSGVGLGSPEPVHVTVAPGGAVRDLVLPTNARINLEVEVSFPAPQTVFVTVAASDGRFTSVRGSESGQVCVFANLPAGRYTVGPMDEDDGKSGSVDLAADGPAVRRIALGPDGVRPLD